jgi:type VI secretion system protein ImpG
VTKELLPFYERELDAVFRLGKGFGEAHPQIARRLVLHPDSCGDPHVERLIQAFAYVSARVRHKIEDDFPELTESLLGVLYPHYQAPIPSMAVAQLELSADQNQLTAGHQLARGTPIDSEPDPVEGESCHFRTCYDTTLWPIEVVTASLRKRSDAQAPATRFSRRADAVIRIVLRCRDDSVRFADLALDRLRFFLKGQSQHAFRLYELILNSSLGVAAAASPSDPQAAELDAGCLRPVGFGLDEGMLPYPARSFLGYRLLTEFFTFVEKFLFFELGGLGPNVLGRAGNQLELFLYLSQAVPELEHNVSRDAFWLGCTPVVNLYRLTADPIRLTETDPEYHVVLDARRPRAHEIYSIDSVTASAAEDRPVSFRPFFAVTHATAGRAPRAFWHAVRRPAEAGEGRIDPGTELYLRLVDVGGQPITPTDWATSAEAPGEWTATVETTCLNRDLPHQLPTGPGKPELYLAEGSPLVSRVVCLTRPTPTLRPARRHGALWRLISHLALNHLSLADDDDQAVALREILALYDFTESEATRKAVAGVDSVRSRRTVRRVGGAAAGFCRGVEVTARFDEQHFTGGGLFLFASVLERFLSLYCTVNSFTEFVATTKGRGELRRWPPRVGEQILA